MAEWLANHRHLPVNQDDGLTIMELAAAYFRHAKSYYRKDGQIPSSISQLKRVQGGCWTMLSDTLKN